MIPTWLRRHLEETGRWNTGGIGRAIRSGTCTRCPEQVIRALDSDVAAIPATCDPQPVDQLGEALALIAGRTTYTLHRHPGGWQLDPRDEWRIRAGRPGSVLAEHRCHAPPLPTAADPEPVRPTGEPTW